ncbi:hypothetical protein ACFLSY_03840, partial [Bacteroidota bacterium]
MENSFDLKKIKTQLNQLPTITDKLDYWIELKTKYIDTPFESEHEKYQDNLKNIKNKLSELFGKGYKLESSILMPVSIYNKHFKYGLSNSEFTYWFLKYNAKQYFKIDIKMKYFDEKKNSPTLDMFINAELKELNEFEQRAKELLLDKKLEIYDPYIIPDYTKEIEFLRIKADYYKTHPLPDVLIRGNITVIIYAE